MIDSASFRVPLDWAPDSNMFIAVAAPTGGLGNFPALVKGDTGDTPTIDTTITLTALEWDDVTPDSASWTEISPDTYRLSLSLHKGEPGEGIGSGGITVLAADDVSGTPVYKKILVVTATHDGLEFMSQKVGDRYIPASIASTPSGNATYTLCSVGVAAQPWDWRPLVSGYTIVTGTGSDVQVDVLARLDNASSGNIVGRASQPAGQYPACHVLSAGPPAGSADSYDKVAANTAATIYLRAERQSGTNTFTTSASTTGFAVRVCPIL